MQVVLNVPRGPAGVCRRRGDRVQLHRPRHRHCKLDGRRVRGGACQRVRRRRAPSRVPTGCAGVHDGAADGGVAHRPRAFVRVDGPSRLGRLRHQVLRSHACARRSARVRTGSGDGSGSGGGSARGGGSAAAARRLPWRRARAPLRQQPSEACGLLRHRGTRGRDGDPFWQPLGQFWTPLEPVL